MTDESTTPSAATVPRSLAEAWEANAERWVAWARTPGHDSYWQFHRDVFRRLLPPPRGRVVDIGCGEGRLPRDMKSWGYDVVGVDASQTLIKYAREADPAGEYHVANAAALPLEAGVFDVAIAFMTLHDVDDLQGVVTEIARVLAEGGRLCMAVVHPIASAGHFESREPDAAFVIDGSYLATHRVDDTYERRGLVMQFNSEHRPLGMYFDAFEAAGLKVERLVDVPDTSDDLDLRWRRIPNFLHMRAVKLAA